MIKISEFNYNLPDQRIAKFPVSQRDHSKLLIYRKGNITQDHFYNIADHLPKGALLVFNNTRVIRARMHFQKETGAIIEIFLLEPFAPADYEQNFQGRGKCQWLCLVGNKKKWKEGPLHQIIHQTSNIKHPITLSAQYIAPHATSQIIEFTWNTDHTFADILDLAGQLPIPPYLNRDTQTSDLTTYQTVYSKIKGSVAAPTAGLHFTPTVLHRIDAHGIQRDEVTLHVGAGTFKPVKTEDVADHEMHTEHFSVTLTTIQNLIRHDAKAIAVGTTSVRTLESLYYIGVQIIKHTSKTANPDTHFHVSQWEPYQQSPNTTVPDASPSGPNITPLQALKAIEQYLLHNNLHALNASTQIIITPAGYQYKIVSALITNFHQPKSTLLLLVSALIGNAWRQVYDYALANDFRFLSYGDSSLLIP